MATASPSLRVRRIGKLAAALYGPFRMDAPPPDAIFLATFPGLESTLAEEAGTKGFRQPRAVPGGVTIGGGWPEVWRANLWLRGASRVLARVARFPAHHLSTLDARARAMPWTSLLRPAIPFRVIAECHGSRLYHSGAVAERVARAIHAATGGLEAPGGLRVLVRMADDVCTISLDTSGEPLHRRGFKQAIGPAPLRETMAALFLQQCGYRGEEPLVDPLCGSGTFVLEAAEQVARLNPGRERSFAFEGLVSFDQAAWSAMRAVRRVPRAGLLCHGSDRDAGAIAMATANAERAGLAEVTRFQVAPISSVVPPAGPPGLVMVNPPYGARLAEGTDLRPLYQSLGRVLRERFVGWRIGMVTSEPRLAAATALPFLPPGPPVPHGGLRVRLYRTSPLAP